MWTQSEKEFWDIQVRTYAVPIPPAPQWYNESPRHAGETGAPMDQLNIQLWGKAPPRPTRTL